MIEGDLLTGAIAFARRSRDRRRVRKTRELPTSWARPVRGRVAFSWPAAIRPARHAATWRHRSRPSTRSKPPSTLPFDEGLQARAGDSSPTASPPSRSRALIHAFFAERAVSKVPDIPKEHASLRHRTRSHHRGRNHGRRHRDGVRQCRHSRAAEGCRTDRRSTAVSATIRKNYETSVKKGTDFGRRVMDHGWRSSSAARLRRRSSSADLDRRSRVREHGAEEAHLRRDRQGRQARLRAGVEYVHARYRRDRVGDLAAGAWSSGFTSSARRTSCGCWRSCAERPPATK